MPPPPLSHRAKGVNAYLEAMDGCYIQRFYLNKEK